MTNVEIIEKVNEEMNLSEMLMYNELSKLKESVYYTKAVIHTIGKICFDFNVEITTKREAELVKEFFAQ